MIRVAWFCVKDHGFTRHSAVIGPKFCVARVLANEDKQPNRCVNLLLSHTDLVKVMPIANDFPGGCPGVRLVEDYNVCFLRWFTWRRIQIQPAAAFTLNDSSGDISWFSLDRGPWGLRKGDCHHLQEEHG